MSWDVMIFHLRERPRSVKELDEAIMLPLGPVAAVRAAISSALPTVDWSDPRWGVYDGDGFSIEFNAGGRDPIQNMMLHVRGGGDAIADIMKFVVPNGWAALDCSTAELLDPDAPSDAGWIGFQKYRDQIMKRGGGEVTDEP